MPRREYLHDRAAPPVNSIVPAVGVVARDDRGRLLLVRRRDAGTWALPGGAQEPGESVAGAAVREAAEETGLDVEVTGIVGVYSDPGHVIAYDDGEVRQEFSVVLRARVTGGELSAGDDASAAAWFAPGEVDGLAVSPPMRLRIAHGLSGGPPYVG